MSLYFLIKKFEFRYDEQAKYCFCDKLVDFWNHVTLLFEKMQFELNAFGKEIEEATKTRNYYAITFQMVLHGTDLRSQLIIALRTKECYKILFNDNYHTVQELRAKFDRRIISWLGQCLKAIDSEVNCYNIRSNIDIDFSALEKTKPGTKERLHYLRNICSQAASWQLFEKDEVNDLVSGLTGIHAKFDLYLQNIDEHSKQLVENCRKAQNLASQFLNRLQNENENISTLLEELG